jgi:hypothetical protein
MSGSGDGSLVMEITSGDLHQMRARATARFDRATIVIPKRNLKVEGLDGEVPFEEEVRLANGHWEPIPSEDAISYRQLRFADQHPLLRGRGVVYAQRISAGPVVLGPLACDVRFNHDLVSLDQLEAQLRGGRITGQGFVALKGADSVVQLRLRASGIESSSGGTRQTFDGNAALRLSLRNRNVDGRIEILRIGRQHLLDLVDLYDPHHADVPTNRLRMALKLGYPDRVRLLFDRGFASLGAEFGGLARLLRIHEVRGIATGPIVERYLGSLFPTEDER